MKTHFSVNPFAPVARWEVEWFWAVLIGNSLPAASGEPIHLETTFAADFWDLALG
jgi:hypothetical protein